jgi:DNA-binding SARP family transcriptional activator
MLDEGLGEVTMAVWGYGLLGPVEVQVNGGAIEFAGARQRLILVMLLLAANQQVPAGRLMDELWGEALPRDPAGALRTQISRLRRALGPAGDSLITVEGGFRLRVQRAQLDATRFEDALAEAEAEAATAPAGPALGILDRASACGAARPSANSPAGRSRSPRP